MKNKDTYIIVDIDGQTGEETRSEPVGDELKTLVEIREQALALVAETEARVTARESALAKLADLGLTADEVAAL